MSTNTPNFNFILPGVNDPTDQDLWGGYLNSNWSNLDALLKAIQTAAELPIGALYMNKTDATNPATSLGYGTWTQITDTFIVAAGTTFTSGSTGGQSSVTLSAGNIPALTGTVDGASPTGSGSGLGLTGSGTGFGTLGVTVNSGTANTPISTLPPYVTAYIWERTG